MDKVEKFWRERIATRCGGEEFDKPGTGYSFGVVLEEERELERRGDFNVTGDPSSALLKLSVADPMWKMPEGAIERIGDYYENCDDATRYTDNSGIRTDPDFTPLAKRRNRTNLMATHVAIANFLNNHQPNLPFGITPEHVQYSPGSIKRLLAEFIPSALFDKDKSGYLIFPIPGYGVMKDPINIRGGIEVVNVEMKEENGSWILPIYSDTQTDIARFKKSIMYVNDPHNPTGMGHSKKQWEGIIECAKEQEVILVVDEAYTDIRYNSDTASVMEIPGWEECCIILRSISKGWSATGARFGFVIAHPVVIRALRKVMDVKDSGGFGPVIAAAQECLLHPEWAEDTRLRYQGLHKILAEGLGEVGFKDARVPDAGLCQFVKAPKSINGIKFETLKEMVQYVREKLRISVMHFEVGSVWYLRIAVTVGPMPDCNLSSEESIILEAIRRLKGAKLEF